MFSSRISKPRFLRAYALIADKLAEQSHHLVAGHYVLRFDA